MTTITTENYEEMFFEAVLTIFVLFCGTRPGVNGNLNPNKYIGEKKNPYSSAISVYDIIRRRKWENP